MRWKQKLKYIPCLLFLGLVLWLSVTNLGTLFDFMRAVPPINYVEFTTGLEAHLSNNLVQKYDYIGLNGTMTRLLDIHSLNERQKLKSGHLADFSVLGDQTKVVDLVAPLAEALEKQNIGFLCIPMPNKANSFSAEFAPGYEQDSSQDLDALFEMLDQRQVPNLDMDGWFEAQGWTMDDIYFKTDHHWRPEAALETVRQIMRYLEQTGQAEYEESSLAPENWKTESYPDWFLGSDGRRTGIGYAGADDLVYLHPAYKTDILAGRLNWDGTQDMRLQDTVYDARYFDEPSGYEMNGYCLYLGGDYSQAYIRNTKAVNDKRILVVGDSYRLPVEVVLSTQFKELYHIDMRYYKDGTFMEYLQQVQPDVVVLQFCLPASYDVLNFRVQSWNRDFGEKTARELDSLEQVSFPVTDGDEDYQVLWENLEPGSYEITLDRGTLQREPNLDQSELGIYHQLSLLDGSGENQMSRFFLSNYGESQKWLFTVPEGTTKSVIAYNGSQFYTRGNTSTLEGIHLKKYE